MNTFPVTSSVLSAEALGEFVKAKYAFDGTVTCWLFRTGINHTYLVEAGNEKYVFRVYFYEWRTAEQIAEELNLLSLLKDNDISISYPIEDMDGNYMNLLNAPEGKRYAVLFSFAEGEKVRIMDTETCGAIGKLMAEIHSNTINRPIGRINYNAEMLVTLPYQYTTKYFSESLDSIKFLKEQGEKVIDLFKNTDTSSFRKGIVHLDIWYDNMSVSKERGITIFDFDFCGNGWLMLDIAYFCTQLFHIETDKSQYEAKKEAFLEGYKKVLEIPEEEMELVPAVGVAIWLFYLGVQARRFDWSNIFYTENYLNTIYTAKIRNWVNYYEGLE